MNCNWMSNCAVDVVKRTIRTKSMMMKVEVFTCNTTKECHYVLFLMILSLL